MVRFRELRSCANAVGYSLGSTADFASRGSSRSGVDERLVETTPFDRRAVTLASLSGHRHANRSNWRHRARRAFSVAVGSLIGRARQNCARNAKVVLAKQKNQGSGLGPLSVRRPMLASRGLFFIALVATPSRSRDVRNHTRTRTGIHVHTHIKALAHFPRMRQIAWRLWGLDWGEAAISATEWVVEVAFKRGLPRNGACLKMSRGQRVGRCICLFYPRCGRGPTPRWTST